MEIRKVMIKLKELEEMDVLPYSSSVVVDKVYDQLETGQCGACAGAYAIHEVYGAYPSHTYIYGMDNERFASGMYFDVLTNRLLLGVPREVSEDVSMLNKEKARLFVRNNPPKNKELKFSSYLYLYTWKQVLNAIRLYHGCLISVNVYDNWRNVGSDGVIGKRKGKLIGRHIVFCKDYKQLEDGTYVIRFVNSWGDSWGENGCGYINTKEYSFHNAVCFEKTQCE